MLTLARPDVDIAQYADGLYPQQLEAFWKAIAWWQSRDCKHFVISGYAGTGKTFLLQRIVHAIKMLAWADNWAVNIAMCAYTNEATRTLTRFAGDAGLTDGVTIATLFSLLRLKPGRDADGRSTIEPNDYAAGPHISEFDLALIDEGSMLGAEVLIHVPTMGARIMIIGDPGQLPSVEESECRGAEPVISPVFDNPDVLLTETVRYDGAVELYATALRHDLTNSTPPSATEFLGGNLVAADRNLDRWMADLIKRFQSNRYETRALAYTNRRVVEINAIVRREYHNPATPYVKGEFLIAKGAVSAQNEFGSLETAFQTCDRMEVVSTYSATERLSLGGSKAQIPVIYVKLRNAESTERLVKTIDPVAHQAVQGGLIAWRNNISGLNGYRSAQAWAEWFDFQRLWNVKMNRDRMLSLLQYSYCSTTHQAQGCTIPYTFVDQVDMWRCGSVGLRNRLLYTAVTRTGNELNVVGKY